MGGLVRYVDRARRPALDEMVLARDEFGETRDLFQQGFEIACKILRYWVAAQNAAKRGDPGDFGTEHPASVPERRRAASLE